MEALAPKVDRVIITAIPDTPLPDLEVLSTIAKEHGAWVDVEPDLEQALDQARDYAAPRGGLLIAGSLHLVGAVIPSLPGVGGLLASVDP